MTELPLAPLAETAAELPARYPDPEACSLLEASCMAAARVESVQLPQPGCSCATFDTKQTQVAKVRLPHGRKEQAVIFTLSGRQSQTPPSMADTPLHSIATVWNLYALTSSPHGSPLRNPSTCIRLRHPTMIDFWTMAGTGGVSHRQERHLSSKWPSLAWCTGMQLKCDCQTLTFAVAQRCFCVVYTISTAVLAFAEQQLRYPSTVPLSLAYPQKSHRRVPSHVRLPDDHMNGHWIPFPACPRIAVDHSKEVLDCQWTLISLGCRSQSSHRLDLPGGLSIRLRCSRSTCVQLPLSRLDSAKDPMNVMPCQLHHAKRVWNNHSGILLD